MTTEHLCATPPEGSPGDAWCCPDCGREWWADDLEADTDEDWGGCFIAWRPLEVAP